VDRVFEGMRLRASASLIWTHLRQPTYLTARKGGWDVHLEAFETVGVEAVRRGIRSASCRHG